MMNREEGKKVSRKIRREEDRGTEIGSEMDGQSGRWGY
jgi:hypothetical protein